MEHGKVIKIAEGQFPFRFFVKAIASEELGKMVVEGVASTPNVDHDHERMAPEALKAMANIINTSGVPLRVEHSQNSNAIIGNVNKAWIDERNQLWIKAVLDESHPAAGILYKGLKEGVKMGLSVGGYVKRATQEMVEGVGKMVNTFYDVLLDEVSVTQKPSNYDARLMAKSFAKSEGEVDALAGAFESNEFLFHNAIGAGDYLQTLRKSIPDSEWKDVTKSLKDNNNSMEDTEKKTKGGDDTEKEKTTKGSEKEKDTEMTKAVSREEFEALGKNVSELVKAVGQLGNSMTSALEKMAKGMGEGEGALDQRQPEQKKEDPEAGKDVSKSSGGEALDGEQPKQVKKDPEAGKDVSKDREKTERGAGADDGNDLHGEREKSAKEDEYDLTTVERAIKRIKSVSDRMGKGDDSEKEKTTKAEEPKSEDTETRKSRKDSPADMDVFVVTVADTIERMEKSMKEGGFQTNHIAKTMINQIRSNPELRKSIVEFMAQPGEKRSVVNGTPFVKMKDGRMFALTLSEQGAERTEKSAQDAPKTFKAMWGAKFSSTPVKE